MMTISRCPTIVNDNRQRRYHQENIIFRQGPNFSTTRKTNAVEEGRRQLPLQTIFQFLQNKALGKVAETASAEGLQGHPAP
uniref:Uncharacterized protein n=1 Tax=Panagrellus redivivus TaxID=6233 RepID=A0A7E4ZSR9_PANRE